MAKIYESTFTQEEKEYFMRKALELAQKAFDLGEVPIGCIIVKGREIVATGYNLREISQDATTHAEINAIREANRREASFRLEETALFVTVEPCIMCAGACLLARIPEIYYGCKNAKGGALGTVLDVANVPALNHAPYVQAGLLEEDCGKLMRAFFSEKREQKRDWHKASI